MRGVPGELVDVLLLLGDITQHDHHTSGFAISLQLRASDLDRDAAEIHAPQPARLIVAPLVLT